MPRMPRVEYAGAIYVGVEKVPEWLACDPILAFCGRKPAEQRREYRRFVESALGGGDEETGRLLKSAALAVAFQLQRLAARLEADRALRRQLAALEKKLSC